LSIINDPSGYYKKNPDLFFEFTISESLSDLESPYIPLLNERKTYSEFIFQFLQKYLKKFDVIVEIGGGYGNFMKNLLQFVKPEKVIMVDISEKFLQKQKQTLSEYKNIEFVNSDATNFIKNFREKADIIILNEVIGDFKTLVDVSTMEFGNFYQINVDYLPKRTNINIEALEFINIASEKTDAIFFAEHSSTYKIPDNFSNILIDEKESFSPREIKLKGHSEYTINFIMLEEAAKYACFETVRKHLMDIIPLKRDKIIEFVLKSKTHQIELHEIIDEFYNHIKEYEALLCYKV
jgi:ribosomal protein S7